MARSEPHFDWLNSNFIPGKLVPGLYVSRYVPDAFIAQESQYWLSQALQHHLWYTQLNN